MKKRYQYWGSENGEPVVLWTEWFPYEGEKEYKQPNKLKVEYMDEPNDDC